MIYCDASFVVPVLATEMKSLFVERWFARQDGRSFAISAWVRTEVASALAMKMRQGIFTRANRDAALGTRTTWSEERFRTLSIDQAHFARAAELVDSPPCGLRSGDALHLAIVLDQGCELATFDHDLADAARALGVTVHSDP